MASEEKPEDAPINAHTAGPEVLEKFWNLAALDEGQRVESASALVAELETSQKAFLGSTPAKSKQDGGPGKHLAISKPYKQQEIDQILSSLCSPLMVYGLQRLVKGLASGRQAARQGFALALALLLSKVPELPTEAVLALLSLHLQATKSMSGSDAKDALLGKLFGMSAVIKARDLSASPTVAIEVATSLLGMMSSKVYLREACASAFLDFTATMNNQQIQDLISGVPALKELLTGPADSATPEGLVIALHLWDALPPEILKKCAFLPSTAKVPGRSFFTSSKPDAESHPTEAAQAFFAAAHFQVVLGALKITTNSHPRIHRAILTVLGLLIPGFAASKVNAQEGVRKGQPEERNLESFWRMFVEDELLCSSSERKFLAFQLFNILLPFLGADQVPVVISASFSQVLQASLAKKDSLLNPIAKKAMTRIQSVSEHSTEPAKKAAFAVVLQRQPGSLLSQHANKKNKAGIMQSMDDESTHKYLLHLQAVFEGREQSEPASQGTEQKGSVEGEAEEVLEARRRWSLEQLAGICGLPNIQLETQTSITHYLITHSFFNSDQVIAEATRKLCASRLMTILEAAGKAQRSDSKAAGDTKPGEFKHERRGENELLKSATRFLALEQDKKALVIELSEPIQSSLKSLRAVEKKLAKAHASSLSVDDNDSRARGMKELAFLHLVRWLQLYIVGDAENIEADLAEELTSIYQSALGKSSDKKRKSVGSEPTPWQDRLVDVLLSLTAYSSAQLPSLPLRDAVEAAFRAFAQDITQTGLEDIVRVIAKPYDSSKDPEDDVMEDDDEEESESEEEEEEEDESADEDMLDANDGLNATDQGTTGAEERNGKAHDAGPASTSDSESEEEGMTDEQMFKMDTMLVAVLKTQKDAKSSVKTTKQAMVNFKLRSIALLEAYSKACPHSPFIAGVLGDLVKAAANESKSNGSQAVSERLRGVIAKICKTKPHEADCQSTSSESISKGILLAHNTSAKTKDKTFAACADTAIHYLISVAFLAKSGDYKQAAISACDQIQANFFKRRDMHISANLLPEIAKRHNEMAEALSVTLVEHLQSARTAFLQIQAAQYLGVNLKAIEKAFSAATMRDLANATASIIEGDGFPIAQKHADCLKNLAIAWQTISKRFPESISSLDASARDALKAQCAPAHGIAVNGKISNAIKQIGSHFGLKLGEFDPSAPKRKYQDTKPQQSTKQAQKKPAKQLLGHAKIEKAATKRPESSAKDKGQSKKRSQPPSELVNGSKKKAKAAVQKEGSKAQPVSGVVIEDPLADDDVNGVAQKKSDVKKKHKGKKEKKKAKLP